MYIGWENSMASTIISMYIEFLYTATLYHKLCTHTGKFHTSEELSNSVYYDILVRNFPAKEPSGLVTIN